MSGAKLKMVGLVAACVVSVCLSAGCPLKITWEREQEPPTVDAAWDDLLEALEIAWEDLDF